MTLEEKLNLTNYEVTPVPIQTMTRVPVEAPSDDAYVQIFHPKYFNCFVWNMQGSVKVDSLMSYTLQYLATISNETRYSRDYAAFGKKSLGFYMFVLRASDFLYGEERVPMQLTVEGLRSGVKYGLQVVLYFKKSTILFLKVSYIGRDRLSEVFSYTIRNTLTRLLDCILIRKKHCS